MTVQTLRVNVPKYAHSSPVVMLSYAVSWWKEMPYVPMVVHGWHLWNAISDRNDFHSTCASLTKFVSAGVPANDQQMILVKTHESYSYGMPLTEILSLSGIVYNGMKYIPENHKDLCNQYLDVVVKKITSLIGTETQPNINYVDKTQSVVLGVMIATGLLSFFFGGNSASMAINYTEVSNKIPSPEIPVVIEVINYTIPSEDSQFTDVGVPESLMPIDAITADSSTF